MTDRNDEHPITPPPAAPAPRLAVRDGHRRRRRRDLDLDGAPVGGGGIPDDRARDARRGRRTDGAGMLGLGLIGLLVLLVLANGC